MTVRDSKGIIVTTGYSVQVMLDKDPGGPATVMGTVAEAYTENRATLHLHGGNTVWISDGNVHQWITPANEGTPYPAGVSARLGWRNVLTQPNSCTVVLSALNRLSLMSRAKSPST